MRNVNNEIKIEAQIRALGFILTMRNVNVDVAPSLRIGDTVLY